MKITKLPDGLDPNKLIADAVLERNRRCPFCGEDRDYTTAGQGVYSGLSLMWFGKKSRKFEWIPFGDRNWREIHFVCYSCGAKWKSAPFPTDVDVIAKHPKYRPQLYVERSN